MKDCVRKEKNSYFRQEKRAKRANDKNSDKRREKQRVLMRKKVSLHQHLDQVR